MENLSYKYFENVRFEKPEKEKFPEKPPVGEANTEYISPALPEKLPVNEKGDDGSGKGCGSVATAGCLIPLVTLVLICAKKKKER